LTAYSIISKKIKSTMVTVAPVRKFLPSRYLEIGAIYFSNSAIAAVLSSLPKHILIPAIMASLMTD